MNLAYSAGPGRGDRDSAKPRSRRLLVSVSSRLKMLAAPFHSCSTAGCTPPQSTQRQRETICVYQFSPNPTSSTSCPIVVSRRTANDIGNVVSQQKPIVDKRESRERDTAMQSSLLGYLSAIDFRPSFVHSRSALVFGSGRYDPIRSPGDPARQSRAHDSSTRCASPAELQPPAGVFRRDHCRLRRRLARAR